MCIECQCLNKILDPLWGWKMTVMVIVTFYVIGLITTGIATALNMTEPTMAGWVFGSFFVGGMIGGMLILVIGLVMLAIHACKYVYRKCKTHEIYYQPIN